MARLPPLLAVLLPASLVMPACEASPSRFGPGLDLQVRAAPAQLRRGGLAPDEGGPPVSQVLRPQPEITRGDATVQLRGRLGPGGVSLHLQAEGDDDHWLVAPDGYDFVVTDELLWGTQLEFSHAIAGDRVGLRLQAVDARGRAGPVQTVDFVVLPDMPPSQLLVSLGWNSAVDLDLYVELPDGTIVGPKNPTSNEPTDGVVPPPDAWMDSGVYPYDSNQQCRLDLRNREDVVWVRPPPSGTYRVYVHLFSPCDAPSVDFQVLVQRNDEVIDEVGGSQYAFDSRVHPAPGEVPGLLVLELEVP
ncbi:MAG: hypothetical protein AB1Z98_28965 [Nannocystaceae bacterium]